jgi:hypothetical protein
MKIPYKLSSIAFISTFIFGCSSTSIQNVARPDINLPLNENETIIQLKRADYYQGLMNNTIVQSNNTFIGELANAGELVWKTNANSLECIMLGDEATFATFTDKLFTLEGTPVSYKCFKTKPKEMMTLNFDFKYPELGAFRGIAFTPIFKSSSTFDKNSKVTVNVINSISTETQNKKDIKVILENAVKKQFGNSLASSSNKIIDIEILDYKTGNAAARWVVKSMKGSTFAKVKVIIKEGEQVVDTFVTRPVVSGGGLSSIGADEYIFDDIAQDIYLYLFGKSS